MKKPNPLSALFDLGQQFYLLFSSGILANIGCFTTQTALLLHVYKISGHNASYTGLMALAEFLPFVLATPISGAWAEKHNRKLIMIGSNVVRIPLLLAMMATNSIWILFLLQAAVSVTATLSLPSRQAILPEIVKPRQLELANSLDSGVLSVVHVLGPALGAMLYAHSGTLGLAVEVEAVASLLSALLLLLLAAQTARPQASEEESLMAEIRAGFAYVRAAPDLRQIAVILLVAGMANGLYTPLLRPFIEEVLRGGDELYAHMFMAFGAGGMLGPLLGYLLGRRLGVGRILTWTFILEGALLLLLTRTHSPRTAVVLMFLWGVNEFTMLPCYMSYVHLFARKEMMGRTFALLDMGEFLPQIVAAGLIFGLGNLLPTQHILTVTSACYLAIAIWVFFSKGGRLLRTSQPI